MKNLKSAKITETDITKLEVSADKVTIDGKSQFELSGLIYKILRSEPDAEKPFCKMLFVPDDACTEVLEKISKKIQEKTAALYEKFAYFPIIRGQAPSHIKLNVMEKPTKSIDYLTVKDNKIMNKNDKFFYERVSERRADVIVKFGSIWKITSENSKAYGLIVYPVFFKIGSKVRLDSFFTGEIQEIEDTQKYEERVERIEKKDEPKKKEEPKKDDSKKEEPKKTGVRTKKPAKKRNRKEELKEIEGDLTPSMTYDETLVGEEKKKRKKKVEMTEEEKEEKKKKRREKREKDKKEKEEKEKGDKGDKGDEGKPKEKPFSFTIKEPKKK
jgi:hypothetical protein